MTDDEGDLPLVSVVVLTFNGRVHIGHCLPSLLAQTYPADRIDLLVVDNASTDGTADLVARDFPGVRLHCNPTNDGFAAGNNLGARLAQGELVAFLNQDMRVEPDWLAALVAPWRRARRAGERDLACIAGKILTWDGAAVDFAGARMTFAGKARQAGLDRPDAPEYAHERPLLFPCGGAMLIERRVFLDAGGFDPDYFLFFEDVDLGWRLWVLGYRVQFAPGAVAYHRGHASTGELSAIRRSVLWERNALASIIKNYDDVNLARALPAALLLIVRQVTLEMESEGWRPDRYHLRRADRLEHARVHPKTAGLLLAVREVMDALPALLRRRATIQAARRRPDADILPLLEGALEPTMPSRAYAEGSYAVADGLGVSAMFAGIGRLVLVVAPDILPLPGLPATGAGLRAWGIGQGLAGRGHHITYSMPRPALAAWGAAVPDAMASVAWTPETLAEVVHRVDPEVIVVCGWYPALFLGDTDRIPVAIDQHGPHLIERAYHRRHDAAVSAAEKIVALRRADFFTCAGERQRHYFIPWLIQAGFDATRLGEQTAVVPLALAPDLPAHAPEGEPTFVFGGVFLPWQDPTAALTTLADHLVARGRGRLLIFGGEHPAFAEVGAGVYPALRERLADSPRVTVAPMLPRDELLAVYARAHAAIDLMARNAERELAVTTRTVEYLWCGLPVIYNDYSELSDHIRRAEAGWTLAPDHADGLRAVIDAIIDDPAEARRRGANAQRLVRERMTWDRAIDPLDRFIRRPLLRARAEATAPPNVPSAAAPPATPPDWEPLLATLAARRRSPLGRAAGRARGAVKAALRLDRPTRQDGRLVQPTPELIGGRAAGQAFVAADDGLCGVTVRLGTYGRLNTGALTLRLHPAGDDGGEIAATVPAALVRDGAYQPFRFAPLPHSSGRTYSFTLAAPDAVPGDALCAWVELDAAEPTERRTQDGQPAPGRLAFRAEYAPGRRGGGVTG